MMAILQYIVVFKRNVKVQSMPSVPYENSHAGAVLDISRKRDALAHTKSD